VQLNVSISPLSIEIAALLAAVVLLFAALTLLSLYRKYPMHLIYRSKIGVETMLDAVDEPLAVISKEFNVKRVNRAYIDLTGRSYKNCINAKCYALLRGLTAPCADCRMHEALEQSEARQIETSPHPKGVGSFHITFSPYAMPMKGNTEEICVIEHIRDITTLEKLKMDLERRNNFLTTLTRRLRAARRSIKAELRVARQIQFGLLPTEPPHSDNIRINMVYNPVADVGGDLYDFIRIDDNRLGVFVGDASGHGLASSLIGTLTKMSLYHHSQTDIAPAELLARLNRDLTAHIHSSHYMTCFWGIFDFEKKTLTYSRAGHPPQIARRKDGTTHRLTGNGVFLGIIEDSSFEQVEFRFEKGDRFFFFTDGTYDIFSNETSGQTGRLLGYEGFAELVNQSAENAFEEIIPAIKKGLSGFNLNDDYTLMAAEVL